MAFENATTWFYWFIRKLRDNPSDVIFPIFLLAMITMFGWLFVSILYTDMNSERTECTKFAIDVFVDPETGEERISGENKCVAWISPVTGKVTLRKE